MRQCRKKISHFIQFLNSLQRSQSQTLIMDSKTVKDFCEKYNKGEDETESIFEACVETPCNLSAGIKCPRFVAIHNHVDLYCRDYRIDMTANTLVKDEYDIEFWRHAPTNLLDAKRILEMVPWNHFQMDRFSTLIKIYKYQVEHPSFVFSCDPIERRSQKRQICRIVSAHMWENWDTE